MANGKTIFLLCAVVAVLLVASIDAAPHANHEHGHGGRLHVMCTLLLQAVAVGWLLVGVSGCKTGGSGGSCSGNSECHGGDGR